MAGGEPGALERARPLLACFSKAIHHIGGSGAGLEMKLITNRLLTSHLVAIGEAILEIESAGIDSGLGVSVLAQGPVPRLLEYKAPPMAHREHSPQFTVDLMSKDLRLAATRSTPGPIGSLATEFMWAAQEEGFGALDVSAVIEVLSAGGR